VLLIWGRLRPIRVASSLLVGSRLLEGVQLGAVQVLQECVAQQRVVLGVPDDGRNGHESGLPRRAEPALAHDQLVAAGPDAAHHHRLKQPDLLDGVDQLRHGVLVEDLPWLTRVGGDDCHGQLGEVGS
jgi:hypothetical protein